MIKLIKKHQYGGETSARKMKIFYGSSEQLLDMTNQKKIILISGTLEREMYQLQITLILI